MRHMIDGYGANAAYKYFPISRTHSVSNQKFISNVKFWTLTLHTTTCRFAKFDRNGALKFDYASEEGLSSLAQNGIGAPTSTNQDTVWLGCKTCGTANLDNETWKAKAKAAIDAERAAGAAYRAERDAKQKVEDAKDARKRAVQDSRNAWIAKHAEELAAVERVAGEIWDREHSDLLALILKDAQA